MKKQISILIIALFTILFGFESASADEVGSIQFLSGDTEITSFHSGEFIEVVYERSQAYKKGVTLAVACYDAEGRLLQIDYANDKYGNQKKLSTTIKAPEESANCNDIRAMLISSFVSVQPILPIQEINKSESVFYHPVYTVTETEANIPALKRGVTNVMSMTEEEIKATIPKQTGMGTVLNPNTKQAISAVWDPFNPNVVTDKNTGDVFPSETFPNNYSETFTNLRGNEIEVLSYKDSNGAIYYFDALINQQKKTWLYKQLQNLSKLYYLTGEEEYAQRVALILYEWSKYNPDYLNLKDTSTGWVDSTERGWDDDGNPLYGTTPYTWYEKRNESRWSSEMNDVLLKAYDLTYYSKSYEALGVDARKDMEDNLLANRADYVLLFSFDDPKKSLFRNNLITYTMGFVSTGRVLERPQYVHYAYKFCENMAENMTFTRDGFWIEGTSYLETLTRNFGDTFDRLSGYRDPEGYISEISIFLIQILN